MKPFNVGYYTRFLTNEFLGDANRDEKKFY